MLIRSLALHAATWYIRYLFKKVRGCNNGKVRAVFFNRGAFSSDVDALSNQGDVIINSNLLKRLFRYIVPRHQLEQILALHYGVSLRSFVSPLIDVFEDECRKSGVETVYFGGIDYFEVAAFEQAVRDSGAKSVALFHENYVVPLVVIQTRNLLASYPAVPGFSTVYAIGPQAKMLLEDLFDDVKPASLARFQYSEECPAFENDVLIIPFGRIEYSVQNAFALTYSFVIDLCKTLPIHPVLKHKNSVERRQFTKIFGKFEGHKHVLSPSAADYCSKSRLVICYNTLVYYEALAHGHLIAIPSLAEARSGEIYSQHQITDDLSFAGIHTFSSREELEAIISKSMKLTPKHRLQWADARRDLLKESFFSKEEGTLSTSS